MKKKKKKKKKKNSNAIKKKEAIPACNLIPLLLQQNNERESQPFWKSNNK